MKPKIEGAKYKFEILVGYFFTIAVMIIISLIVFLTFRSKLNLFKTKYIAYYEYGNDINIGTKVNLNGIYAGEVKSIDIDKKNRVKIIFYIANKYKSKIREDSVAKIIRPLLIGNKQINISAGTELYKILPPGSILLSEESSELIDLVSGTGLQNFIEKLGINIANPDLTNDIVEKVSVRELYNYAVSSLVTLNEFQTSLKKMSTSMDAMVSSMYSMSENLKSMEDMSAGMNRMSDSFNKINTTMTKMDKNLEDFSPLTQQLHSLLKELEIMMKAFENTWFLRKEIDKIRKEKK